MPRPNFNVEEQTRLEAALAAWGPLAFDSDAFARFGADWRVDPTNQLGAYSLFNDLDVSSRVEVETVGDCGLNGNGYARVSALGDRKLARGQKVAIIPIMGVVTPFQAPKWYAEYGIRVAALPNIVQAARAAASDPEVGRILYAVHSPGGSAFGVGTAAEALREVSKVKPTAAGVTYLSASAAYWLSSAQREIVAEPSSIIGSVGVRMTHIEYSGMLEKDGIRVTEISEPASKSDISPYKPLSESALAEYNRLVSAEYKAFAADISTARRIDMVKNGEQYGRVHSAAHARTIGMIDRVATFEALLGESAPADSTVTRRARLAIMERQKPRA